MVGLRKSYFMQAKEKDKREFVVLSFFKFWGESYHSRLLISIGF
jgi:hypothetical protein